MPGTAIVLAIVLTLYLLSFVVLLVTASVLAKRNNQKVKSVSLSPTHGFTAEFYTDSVRESR